VGEVYGHTYVIPEGATNDPNWELRRARVNPNQCAHSIGRWGGDPSCHYHILAKGYRGLKKRAKSVRITGTHPAGTLGVTTNWGEPGSEATNKRNSRVLPIFRRKTMQDRADVTIHIQPVPAEKSALTHDTGGSKVVRVSQAAVNCT